ncbi:hypothetical protein Pgy4_35873, partial [Pseudomonas savastanoi pv. glycinea str. race 4]
KTGVAPSRQIMLAVDTQVCEGVITSSPGPTGGDQNAHA